MSVDHVGFEDVPHVENREYPFAALVSTASGMSVSAIHETLVKAGVSEERAATNEPEPIGKIRLEGKTSAATIEPVKLRGAKGPEGIWERINERLIGGSAVALCHKDGWMLFTGYIVDDGEMGAVRAIDPNRDHANYYAVDRVIKLIELSTVPEDSPGVHALAVSTEAIAAPAE